MRFYFDKKFESYYNYRELNKKDRKAILFFFVKDFQKWAKKYVTDFKRGNEYENLIGCLCFEIEELEEAQMYEACLVYHDAIEYLIEMEDEIEQEHIND